MAGDLIGKSQVGQTERHEGSPRSRCMNELGTVEICMDQSRMSLSRLVDVPIESIHFFLPLLLVLVL